MTFGRSVTVSGKEENRRGLTVGRSGRGAADAWLFGSLGLLGFLLLLAKHL